jgi:hypothetical protein
MVLKLVKVSNFFATKVEILARAYRVRARDARIRVMHAEHQISVLTLPLQPPLALLIWIQSYQRLNFSNRAN